MFVSFEMSMIKTPWGGMGWGTWRDDHMNDFVFRHGRYPLQGNGGLHAAAKVCGIAKGILRLERSDLLTATSLR